MDTYPLEHMKVNEHNLTYRDDRLCSIESIISLFLKILVEYLFNPPDRGAHNSTPFSLSCPKC